MKPSIKKVIPNLWRLKVKTSLHYLPLLHYMDSKEKCIQMLKHYCKDGVVENETSSPNPLSK